MVNASASFRRRLLSTKGADAHTVQRGMEWSGLGRALLQVSWLTPISHTQLLEVKIGPSQVHTLESPVLLLAKVNSAQYCLYCSPEACMQAGDGDAQGSRQTEEAKQSYKELFSDPGNEWNAELDSDTESESGGYLADLDNPDTAHLISGDGFTPDDVDDWNEK